MSLQYTGEHEWIRVEGDVEKVDPELDDIIRQTSADDAVNLKQ